MSVRTEKVRLVLDDQFSTGMARAAAQAALTSRELDGVSASATSSGTSLRKGAADIDVFSGRLKLMAQAGAAFGPALVPAIGGLVPAVTGLASGMAGAAGAAAAAGLAFAGVGDALGALNDFQLEPSAENFEKLQQAMDELGPAGANFVRFLDSIGGELESLQRIAGDNMFPGMTAGLESLLGLMPRVEDLIGDLSARMGDLAADAGAALAGEKWEAFFAFLKSDAAPIFEDFSRAAGNVALGLGNLMVAFAPLSRDFASGLLEVSRSFAAWSADSSNFQEFIDYVQSVGPQAIDFFVALGEAAVALGEAVAPWGSVVLPAMTALLNVFTAIAGSPIGPALTTAALGMLAFNRAAAAGSAIMGRVAPAVGGMRSSLGQMKTDLATVATSWATAGAATERESKRMAGAAGRLKSSMSTIGKGAGVVGAVGIAASGAADGIGLTNTAMLGLTGTMAGPWGAAAGVGVGLLLDFKAAQDSAKQSASDFAAALDQQTGALTETNHAMALDALSAEQLQIFKDAGVSIQEMTNAALVGGKTWESFRAEMVATNPEFTNSAYGWNFMATEAERAMGAIDGVAERSAEGRKEFQLEKPAKDAAADSTTRYAAAAREAAAAIEAERNAARSTARQFVGLGKSLDDAKVSLGGWLAEMERSARDLERFGQNAARAARRGLDNGLIASLNEAGPAGARRMAQLANATDAEIGRANAAWRRGQQAIQNYVNMRVPPKKITVDIGNAVSNVRAVQAVINSLQGKTVTVTTMQRTIYAAGKMDSIAKVQGKAGGGPIHGPGTGTSDDVPIWASNGEFMIRAAAVDKYGQGFFERLNAMQYADGGPIHPRGAARFAKGGSVKGAGVGHHSGQSWANVAKALDRHGKALDRAANRIERSMSRTEKAIDRNKQELESWNQKRDQLKSQVSNSLQRDWLGGNSGGVWSSDTKSGTAAFAQQQWKQQATDAKQLAATIANLRKNGAGDAFIAEILNSSDPLAAAKMFNQQTKGGMLHSQKLFLDASRSTASAANSTSAIYADEQRKNLHELKTLNNRLERLEKQLDRNHKEAEATRKRESAAKASSKGARDRR